MSSYPYNSEISYSAYVIIGSKLIYSDNLWNGLFEYNLDNNKLRFIDYFHKEPCFRANLHQKAFIWGNYVIFVPSTAKGISYYDLRTEVIEEVEINKWNNARAIDAVIYGNELYLFYTQIDYGIIRFNLDTKQQKLLRYEEILDPKLKIHGKTVLYNKVSLEHEKIWGVIWKTNSILSFDCNNGKTSLWEIPETSLSLTGITVFDNKAYLIANNDYSVYEFDLLQQKITNQFQNDDVFKCNTSLKYCGILSLQGEIIILPENEKRILKVNFFTKKIEPFVSIPENVYKITVDLRGKRRDYLYYEIDGDYLYVPPFGTNALLCVSRVNGLAEARILNYNIEELNMLISRKYTERIAEERMTSGISAESVVFAISDFLRALEEK